MDESQTLQALHEHQKREGEEQNDNLKEEEEEEEEEDDEEEGSQLSVFNQLCASQQQLVELSRSQVDRSRDSQFERPLPAILPENDQCVVDDQAGSQDNSALETQVKAEFKEQDRVSESEILRRVPTQGAESRTQNQLQSSLCPTSLSELSPTSVTQSISSAPSPTLPEGRLSPSKAMANNTCTPEADQPNSSNFRSLSVPVLKSHNPDGYNWRKYGQKQVKSPKGSRSYYKCTYSDCFAKKIKCADLSGYIIEIVNKGTHNHDPPRKNISPRESKVALSSRPVLQNSGTEHPISVLKDSEQVTPSKESIKETPPIHDKKRQNSSGTDGNGTIQMKEENVSEPELKRRVKEENLECGGTILKPGKKPKFVVHAAGDVGISGDGYRWRKYGQKMVKGNPHPRNYYRCTSAGCPVRKHIETAVDNTNAVIITYKGVHDHDMPVPKKRHGPPSALLVAAAAPVSMNTMQVKKTETLQNQVTSTQWSVGKEGELTSEPLDVRGEKEKAIESARTLLSIGFEIKPR